MLSAKFFVSHSFQFQKILGQKMLVQRVYDQNNNLSAKKCWTQKDLVRTFFGPL